MAYCGKCLHLDVCKTAETCDGHVPNCKHFLQKGTLIPVTCKIGDLVWGIKKHSYGLKVKQGVVSQMFYGEDMRLCICIKNVCRGEWGKNVFATEEEAVAKMGGDGQ